ncbi:hypothetical protein [Paenibacillus sp. GCM10027626]|uniref:hypothetical protein n=1 Tax=Paenibacillus sp. GCM10027626 TaxID=3273411 RepID=UPI00363F3FE1
MADEALGGLISSDVFATALGILMSQKPFQLSLFVFGVGLVLISSLIAIWIHIKEGKIA